MRPGIVKWANVAAFDQRLAALRCKLLFLRAKPETIWDRGVKPRIDQQFIRKYAKKFGKSPEEIHKYFVREQEILSDLFERSAMPKKILDGDAIDGASVEGAYRFWTEDLAA